MMTCYRYKKKLISETKGWVVLKQTEILSCASLALIWFPIKWIAMTVAKLRH